MQTPKARPGSLEVPKKKSPATTPRTARKLKTPASESDPVASPNPLTKTPKTQSPKVTERRSPRSPANEIQKKRPSRIPELESQIVQLQEDLKRAKEQLNTSESLKKQAQKEAEETKKQLMEINASEDSRIEELRKLSQERDKVWQSELEALQRQHAMDSAALASAMNEIQKLKAQLENVSDSARAEIQNLRVELSENLSLVEKLRGELFDSKESEARARETISEIQKQFEVANVTLEMLRSDGIKMSDANDSMLMELEQSKAQVHSLEELVENLKISEKSVGGVEIPQENEKVDKLNDELNLARLEVDRLKSALEQSKAQVNSLEELVENIKISEKSVGGVEIPQENEKMDKLNEELNLARLEVVQLKSALEVAEARYHEEYIQSTLQIRSAYEQVESVRSEFSQREAMLEQELKKTKAEMEGLRERLMDTETELQGVAEENQGLNLKIKEIEENQKEPELGNELKKLETDLEDLKSNFMDKEMELQSVTAQNETLKAETEKVQSEKNKVIDEALTKLGNLTEVADKSNKRAEHVAEQLGAAQATNTELEAELRRLKVQCDQWRKAAEAAASMLSGGNNGKYVERTGSLEIPIRRNMNASPYLDDMDDDDSSPKKKNGNMLKKIGVLLKKSQK